MKLLVVLFALTEVTGGQAVTASSELSLEPLIGKFSRFGFNSFFAVYGKVANILQALDTPVVTEQLDKISGKLWELERVFPPEIDEVKEILSDLSKTYKVDTYRVFDEWNRCHFQEGEAVIKALELYVDPVTSKALWCVEWLEENIKPVVIKMSQPFDSSFNQALESLGSTLSSYTKEQEEIGEILQTSLDEAAKLFRMGMETLNKQLKPYLIPFLKEYKKYEPALREWMDAPLFPPSKRRLTPKREILEETGQGVTIRSSGMATSASQNKFSHLFGSSEYLSNFMKCAALFCTRYVRSF